jgi:hypothetical protein
MKHLSVLLAADLLCGIFSLTPVAIAWGAAILFAHYCSAQAWWAGLLLFPLVLTGAFIAAVAVLRLMIPPLRPGKYPVGPNRDCLAWYFHLALGRAIRLGLLQDLIYAFFLSKFLYWRAMGARIPFGVQSSMHVGLADLSLITIGPGCRLGDRVEIFCHVAVGNEIIIGPVRIGRDTEIGARSLIGPYTHIGDNCSIGMGNLLSKTRIGNGVVIRNFEWEHGYRKAPLASGSGNEA